MPIEFPLGGGSGGGGGGSAFPVTSASIVNNSTTSILTLDKVTVKSTAFYYDIFRKSDTDPEAIRSGILFATHKTDSDTWVLGDTVDNFDSTEGVTFSINASTGEISYTSTNYDPTGYTSSLKLQQISELTQ